MGELPGNVVMLFLPDGNARKRGHLCTMVDGTIYDTWDPQFEEGFVIVDRGTACRLGQVEIFATVAEIVTTPR